MKSTEILLKRISRKIDSLIKTGVNDFSNLDEFKPKLDKFVELGIIISFEICEGNYSIFNTYEPPYIKYKTPKEVGGKTISAKITEW